MSKRVVVAMSGGVDSSLSAYLMKEKGYEVIGITLKLFDGQEQYLSDAEKMAKEIGIQWHLADYSNEFKRDIINYFISTYRRGKTPNPCAYCNRFGKFNYLHSEMLKYNCEKIVTGHYARKIYINEKPFVAKGLDKKKDQSYYLTLLENYQLEVIEFPLGEMDKFTVRKLAEQYGLSVHDKKDSQDVCFLEGGDYRDYLKNKINENKFKTGDFILDGKSLGKHNGIELYTVGQRKGLGLSYHEPLYVKSIDPITNNIILCRKTDSDIKGVKIRDTVFHTDKKIFKAKAKLRYRMREESCLVEIHPENRAFLLFDRPQSFPAPGQIAAVYEDDILVGGGFIEDFF
ncbi:tRNA 2-thiouridine(34) synthase MnmA [Deferribacterales bacterium Es71-Z0220]|jgi:tRNA-specific 2-thiouridylase|uniref:tRNA 2-thiouridine(34) synthase MnmA n=1 Tax=Deferrivibrio essentukiensis TaxID=2880922 RepID=UPI001F610A53|nr:tRNA 2-thiouridine(34) synthase MnmA [Deferrivibrio essentukiensis]MCB4205211.1 tRNA 2-thiouridine(34) synthase MnmA [Deferrivibrio essentukiensis]